MGRCPKMTAYMPEANQRLHIAIRAMSAPMPATKGLGPTDRAQVLHNEMERRIILARDAERLLRGIEPRCRDEVMS
jgi:hypothetical protein